MFVTFKKPQMNFSEKPNVFLKKKKKKSTKLELCQSECDEPMAAGHCRCHGNHEMARAKCLGDVQSGRHHMDSCWPPWEGSGQVTP
jgi:hypothetical protein